METFAKALLRSSQHDRQGHAVLYQVLKCQEHTLLVLDNPAWNLCLSVRHVWRGVKPGRGALPLNVGAPQASYGFKSTWLNGLLQV